MKSTSNNALYRFPAFQASRNFQLAVLYCLHPQEIERHRHQDFYELVFVRGGQAVHMLDDKPYPIGPGNIFLIRPGVYHYYTENRELGIYNILFGKSFLRHIQQDLFCFTNFHLMFHPFQEAEPTAVMSLSEQHFPAVLQLLDEIIHEQKNASGGSQTAILSDFLRIILLICRHGHPSGEVKLTGSGYQISRLLARFDADCSREWSLASMAEFTRMSVSSFRQQFRSMTGVPPATYLMQLRLKKAAALLLLPELTIGEIAVRCGFEDSNYFSRQFRAMSGHSPRKFRARSGN